MITDREFIEKLNFVLSKKTLYVMGCFGAPMTDSNKKRYSTSHEYNRRPERTKMIINATNDTFGFDCVCLIKGVLWGWNADTTKIYGGASYGSNGVPDVGTENILNYCTDVSSDFTTIVPGEVVQIPGHVGVYLGDGKVIECTPGWSNNVQITNLGNLPEYRKGHYRYWTKHGKMSKWINYSGIKPIPTPTPAPKPTPTPTPTPVTKNIAVDGCWGPKTTTKAQQVFGTPVDGIVSNQLSKYKDQNPGLQEGWDWKENPKTGSALIKAIQKWAGATVDGFIGPNTIKAMQTKLGTVQDGFVSNPSAMVRAFQKYLNTK